MRHCCTDDSLVERAYFLDWLKVNSSTSTANPILHLIHGFQGINHYFPVKGSDSHGPRSAKIRKNVSELVNNKQDLLWVNRDVFTELLMDKQARRERPLS